MSAHRTKVKLTEEGELFLQYASQILDLVNRSEEEVRIRKEGLQGTLYIASVEGCGPHLFAHGFQSFRDASACAVYFVEWKYR